MAGEAWRIAVLRLGPRLVGQEQVDQRHVGLVRPGERQRLGARAGLEEALDPRLLPEQHAKAPVHDVVVVHHQHPQPPVVHYSKSC